MIDMGNSTSSELIEQAFGKTKKDALDNLEASLKYKYNMDIIIAGDKRGFLYGGAVLEIKYDNFNNMTRAYVELK
jgi:hypothetical protein